MEDEPTQPVTQVVVYSQRGGHQNSYLNDHDLTDIFCVLKHVPKHMISTADGIPSRDIALRFSADLKKPLQGFLFGRSALCCDFPIGKSKKISNIHFRIYINDKGVIMLKDQSTNGTRVEDVLLRGKGKNHADEHILQQDSLITLIMTPPEEDIKFVVWIPQRDGEYERKYHQNLEHYFMRLEFHRQQMTAKRIGAEGEHGPADGPPDLFAPAVAQLETSRHAKEWQGGSKYDRAGTIGKGAFATVYLLATKFDSTLYAAKEVEKQQFMKDGILDQKFDMEMKIMRKIQHFQYVEDIDWGDYLYLIMDYVPNGDLNQLIDRRKRLDEYTVKAMASQLLSALRYLHSMGVTHRDIKPDNVLIQSYDPIYVKLTDFGLSKMVENTGTFLRTFCGTLLYCAPEVYTEFREYDSECHRVHRGKDKASADAPRYGHAVDLWSLGGVLFYTLCGSPPYPAKTEKSHQVLLKSIMTKPLDIRPLQRVGVSEDGISFVRSMLQVRPEGRPTIDQLEASPWLANL